MGYEIDFLAVGDASKSGDAIALRFGNLYGSRDEQTIVVIDGGTQKSGEALCSHIQQFYQTDLIDAVISTHPDADHACGLYEVVNNMRVANLVMHRPWLHTDEILNLFKNESLTVGRLEKKIEKSLQHAKNLEELAESKQIKIFEPFAGLTGFDGTMHVLGPNREYYKGLLPEFRGTPKSLEQMVESALQTVVRKAQEAVEWVAETIDPSTETLDNTHKKTSAENNSSSIILFNFEGRKVLFTGDAGVDAIKNALAYSTASGILLNDLSLIQMPHHGSKHNIDSEILNSLAAKTAMISACADGDPKHPSRKVVNALHRRGFKPIATKGNTIRHHNNAPERPNWSAASVLDFYSQVES
ncbi:MAG TPA: MBL fold metallo-hydrolase [Patescibacteria group bacterium]